MYITAQGPRLRNDLYCVEWDVKLYYNIPYNLIFINDLCDENIEDSDSVAREVFLALLWIVTKIHVTSAAFMPSGFRHL